MVFLGEDGGNNASLLDGVIKFIHSFTHHATNIDLNLYLLLTEFWPAQNWALPLWRGRKTGTETANQ